VGGLSSRSSRTGTAGAPGAWKRSASGFRQSRHPCQSNDWREQDVKWQRAKAGLIIGLRPHRGAAPAGGLRSWSGQFSRRPAGGGASGPGKAQLQQHLRRPRQRQPVLDQRADRGGLQRLGVQAREYPLTRRVGQQPVQRLAGAEPVGAAITGCQQHRCDGGRRATGWQKPEAAAQVEVALWQPPRLVAGTGGERVRGDAVAGGIGRTPGPPPRVCAGRRVEGLPAAGRADNVCELLVDDAGVDRRERGALREGVVLESGNKPGGQWAGVEGAAVSMPVRYRLLCGRRGYAGRSWWW
jgi:hypothetical protein